MNFDRLINQIIQENSNPLISSFNFVCGNDGHEKAVKEFLASKDMYNSTIKNEAEAYVKGKVGEEMYNSIVQAPKPMPQSNGTMPEIRRYDAAFRSRERNA